MTQSPVQFGFNAIGCSHQCAISSLSPTCGSRCQQDPSRSIIHEPTSLEETQASHSWFPRTWGLVTYHRPQLVSLLLEPGTGGAEQGPPEPKVAPLLALESLNEIPAPVIWLWLWFSGSD